MKPLGDTHGFHVLLGGAVAGSGLAMTVTGGVTVAPVVIGLGGVAIACAAGGRAVSARRRPPASKFAVDPPVQSRHAPV